MAIALFGEWGTGKSFFMNKLRDKIEQLSNSERDEYRSGIAHIHFNAWSYLDANLWASIVTKIFEGLNQYINGDTIASSRKDEIQNELNTKLNVLKDERNHYEDQKAINKQRIEDLRTKEDEAEKELEDKIKLVRNASLESIFKEVNDGFDVSDRLSATLESNISTNQTLNDVREIVPEKYWENPELALKEAKSQKVFLHEFFNHHRGCKLNSV